MHERGRVYSEPGSQQIDFQIFAHVFSAELFGVGLVGYSCFEFRQLVAGMAGRWFGVVAACEWG